MQQEYTRRLLHFQLRFGDDCIRIYKVRTSLLDEFHFTARYRAHRALLLHDMKMA